MSQIEQNIKELFAKEPEIEKCVQKNLINRRNLARYLIKQNVAKSNQLEAVVATLRRFPFAKFKSADLEIFKNTEIRIKDKITILDFEKNKNLMHELKKIIDTANYDKGDTLKIVIGTSSITIFLDDSNKEEINYLQKKFLLNKKHAKLSEISILFPVKAIDTKGIISYLVRKLHTNDILISEFLTASSEVILYIKEEYMLKTYQLLKEMQK